MFSVLPGDPAQMMLGQNENSEQLLNIKKKYAFDKPISKQYLLYLNDLSPISIHSQKNTDYTFLENNKYSHYKLLETKSSFLVIKFPYLRTSFTKQGKKVSDIIKDTLPNTLVLAVSSITIAIFIGIFFGIISAIYKDKFIDNFIQIISTIGMSVPSFFSAIIFAWVFGFLLKEYTNLNMTGNIYELDDFGEYYVLNLKNLILPSIVLGIRPLAVISQLMRNELLDVLSQDFIRTARAKGLTEPMVVIKHAMQGGLIPVVSFLGPAVAGLLAGSFVVETIFQIPGLGRFYVEAALNRDYTMILGTTIFFSAMIVFFNLLSDLAALWLNPRSRDV